MENKNMRNDLKDKGLWSPKSIMIIGSLVSFFIAGIMSAINYGRLGYADKKKKLILSITIGYIAFIGLSIMIGEKFDLTASWAGVNIGVSAILKNQQEKLYKDYIKKEILKKEFLMEKVNSITKVESYNMKEILKRAIFMVKGSYITKMEF